MKRPRAVKIAKKIAKWLGLSVAFSLLPFLVNGILFFGTAARPKFSWFLLWPHGELLVVSAGFAVDAISEIIDFSGPYKFPKQLCAWICAAEVLIESIAFAEIQAPGNAYNPKIITIWSVSLFLLTLSTALTCKILGEFK